MRPPDSIIEVNSFSARDRTRNRRPELVETRGPWPFVTFRRYRRRDGSHRIWRSREHRKGLGSERERRLTWKPAVLARCFWMPYSLNWWIGLVFASGSLLFAAGSILYLDPGMASAAGLDATMVNAVFFAGSIPFTTAAYLQFKQAANRAGSGSDGLSRRRRPILRGWHPENVGWLSCALQFPGTVLFNFNTFDALIPGLDWLQEDLTIWAPDIAGSVLFLLSGYLAFVEVGHSHLSWRPRNVSWWVVAFNLMGCIAFMVSAVLAFIPPQGASADNVSLSVTYTLIGALCFFIGSLLMWPEALREAGGHAVSEGTNGG